MQLKCYEMFILMFCRRFVEKELFCGFSSVPKRHDLTYYPTVHDLQNHIYQALRDIEDGILPFTAKAVKLLFCIFLAIFANVSFVCW